VFISLRGLNLKRWSAGEIRDFLVNFIFRGLGIDNEHKEYLFKEFLE